MKKILNVTKVLLKIKKISLAFYFCVNSREYLDTKIKVLRIFYFENAFAFAFAMTVI